LTTMIERVAKAVYDREYRGLPDCDNPSLKPLQFEDLDEVEVAKYRDSARAAIEAMRDPSQGMQLAALSGVNRMHQTRNVWRAMIDAALKETT
jgi:hypothetical protein